MRIPSFLRAHVAGLLVLIVMTVVLGVGYPLAVAGAAQLPGLKSHADGSLVHAADGSVIGSRVLGQSYLDKDGNPLVQYVQSRPSAAGDGYDPTSSSASNLGPESILDVLADPSVKDDTGTPRLLSVVCGRSKAVGELEHVDGSRPFCTDSGLGAVLVVFHRGPGYAGSTTRVVSANEACPAVPFLASYQGVRVECATPTEDLTAGQVVPIRGDAPASPVVPADAVTASGSGLDPDISPAYAALQVPRIARARGIDVTEVERLVDAHTAGRGLGFLGESRVHVLALNRDLDARHPATAS